MASLTVARYAAGDHVVPEQTRQAEARLGGTEGGRGRSQGTRHRAVDGSPRPTGRVDAGKLPSTVDHNTRYQHRRCIRRFTE